MTDLANELGKLEGRLRNKGRRIVRANTEYDFDTVQWAHGLLERADALAEARRICKEFKDGVPQVETSQQRMQRKRSAGATLEGSDR